MIFFDTNVLIYASVNMGEEKLQKSQSVIEKAQQNDEFIVSTLLLQEYAFVLAKLKLSEAKIIDNTKVFSKYCKHSIDCTLLEQAFELAVETSYFNNINDVIHLKFAERYADKLVTFDKDFKKLQAFSSLNIEILK